MIDRDRIRRLLATEREAFAAARPRSRALAEQAREHLLAGVPMSWMAKGAGGFPVFAERAEGARIVDVDGHAYVDFSLGDTGAMAGHAPAATAAAVADRVRRGTTLMLPTEDAPAVAAELGRRFGLPLWQFTLSATDANRFALRLARQVTGRRKVLVFSYCYHGTVDETFAVLEDGRPRSRPGNVGPAVDPVTTTRVAEWNDAAAVERELAAGDVACVLAEPALTNIGIVLPQAGFHADLRDLCTQAGALLAIDETHTLSAGPGGCTAAWGLEPDLVTIGKSIAGGVPAGAYGMSRALGSRVADQPGADYEDVGGIGGTLAGNALSLAAARATLEQVLTAEAFARMTSTAERFERGVAGAIADRGLPWHVVRLGARVEYRFAAAPHVTGGEAAAAADPELEDLLHLFALNRGVLITPFHNMALMSPATTEDDVDRHTEVFGEALDALLG